MCNLCCADSIQLHFYGFYILYVTVYVFTYTDSDLQVMLQAKQIGELDRAAICADAARPEIAFFDDSRPYRRPVQAAASLDISHRQIVSCNTRTVASCVVMGCVRFSAVLKDSKVSMLPS